MRLPRNKGPAFAPSTTAALCPVGGVPAVDRAATALARAGADEVLVAMEGDDDGVERWAEGADGPGDVETGGPAAVSEAASDHDRVVVTDAAALVSSDDLRDVAEAVPAVEVSAADGGTEPVPSAFAAPASAFEDASSWADLVAVGRSVPDPARVPESAALRVRRPWELLAATEAVLGDQVRAVDGDVHSEATLRGPVVVEPGAEIDAGVVVEGPAYVSSGSSVGPNAYVRQNTVVGVDAHVGHGVEIKGSVLLADSDVPHLSYVGDSVIGPGANLGAGTVVANLRHDEADVRVTHDGDRVSTGRRKFGAVVGADAKLGIGTRLNAGVTVGPGGTTHPGEVLTRDRNVEGA